MKMDMHELNDIIYREYKYPVPVSSLCYPEVEELYTESYYGAPQRGIEKADLAAFWVQFDYQGIRNALDIARHYDAFKDKVVSNHVIFGKKTEASPSQLAYLKLLGWNVDKLSLVSGMAWRLPERLSR